MLQMFIAVINENFEVAEEMKKSKQASHYYNEQKARHGTISWLRRLNPYRWVKANPVTVKVDNLPSNLVLPMQKTLIQDYSKGDSRRAPVSIQSLKFTSTHPWNRVFGGGTASRSDITQTGP